jgi:O-antigen ligase
MRGRLQPLLSTGRLGGGVGWPSAALPVAALALNVLAALFVLSSGSKAALVVVAAVLALPVTWVIAARPLWLLYAALLVTMLGGSLNDSITGGPQTCPSAAPAGTVVNCVAASGGTRIFPADLFAGLALAGAIIRMLTRTRQSERLPGLRTIVLSWPFALLVCALMLGVVRGHDRYGTSYHSQPFRIFFYAAIGFTLTSARPVQLFHALTRIFYVTIVVTFFEALYYLGTGKSQTASESLSTGGNRVLALSTAIFLAAGLVLALINLDLDPRGPRRRLHLWMAALAAFCVLVSLGRTTFGAVAVLIPILVIALPRFRQTVLAYAPILLVLLALGGAFVAVVSPHAVQTIGNRFTGNVGTDTAVIQRQRKYKATLQGFSHTPILGFGFGRPVTFIAVDRSVQTFSGDPENSYIYVLAGGGLFALGALLFLIFVYFVDVVARFRRTLGEERALVVFGASLAFILLVNTLSGPILSDPQLMLLTWVGLLVPAVAGRRERTRAVPA